MKRHSFIFLCMICCTFGFCQNDYELGAEYKQGVTLITKYSERSRETRTGLIQTSTKKVLLTPDYKYIYNAQVDDLFIVQDTLKRYGLYSLKEGWLIRPTYKEIGLFYKGYALLTNEGNPLYTSVYGVVDTKGKIVIPLEYEYLGRYENGLLNFRKEKKYGYIDINRNVVIPAKYDNAADFNDGLAVANDVSGKYGYIDKNDAWVIPPKFVFAESFYDGNANAFIFKNTTASSRSDSVGVINKKGEWVIEPKYSYISMKHGGLYRVLQGNENAGVLDSTGRIVFPITKQKIDFPSHGMMVVTRDKKKGILNSKGQLVLPVEYEMVWVQEDGSVVTKKNGASGVIDKNLKFIIPPDTAIDITASKKHFIATSNKGIKIYDRKGQLLKNIPEKYVLPGYTQVVRNGDSLRFKLARQTKFLNLQTGKSAVTTYQGIGDFSDNGISVANDGSNKFYFVRPNGTPINKNPYYAVIEFNEGVAAIQETASSTPYLVDTGFRKIKDLTVVFIGPYSEGLAKGRAQYSNNSFYFLDKKGVVVIYLTGQDVYPFKNGRAKFIDSYGVVRFINRKGETQGSVGYTNALDFSEDLAAVQINGKWGYVDTSGKIIINPFYDLASSFQDGAAVVGVGKQYYLIKKDASKVNTVIYDGANNPGNGTFPVVKGDKYGIVDARGNTIIDFKYENIYPLQESLTWAKKNGKWGLVRKNGQEITGFIYEAISLFNGGYAQVSTNGKVGIIDKNGKIVVPIEYDLASSVYKGNVIVITNEISKVIALPKPL